MLRVPELVELEVELLVVDEVELVPEVVALALASWAEKAFQSKPLAVVSESERSTTANWMLIIAMLRWMRSM